MPRASAKSPVSAGFRTQHAQLLRPTKAQAQGVRGTQRSSAGPSIKRTPSLDSEAENRIASVRAFVRVGPGDRPSVRVVRGLCLVTAQGPEALHPAFLEAPTGFEPANGGFANLCLKPLGYGAEGCTL